MYIIYVKFALLFTSMEVKYNVRFTAVSFRNVEMRINSNLVCMSTPGSHANRMVYRHGGLLALILNIVVYTQRVPQLAGREILSFQNNPLCKG